MHTRLLVIGGFLGAGKTTLIAAAARALTAAGHTLGIVTNDQGGDLVDTQYLSALGFPVLEVTGGCFCCNFDEFVKKIRQLEQIQLYYF